MYNEEDLLILREEAGAEEVVVRVKEKPLLIRYPNFMISAEIIFTGPRWRNIQYLSKTHRRLLDASIFSVDLISTLAKSSARAMQRSVGLQLVLLMFSAFALAIQSIVESLLHSEPEAIGSRMYLALLYPIVLAMILWYIATHRPTIHHKHQSTSGRWIGMNSEESTAALKTSSRMPDVKFKDLKLIETLFEVSDLSAFSTFLPVATCWCFEAYLIYLSSTIMRPCAVCAISLIKLPTAAIMNTLIMERPHSSVQWLFIAAITLLMLTVLSRELKEIFASYVEDVPWYESQPHHVIYFALFTCVLTTILSCRQAMYCRFRTFNRPSIQLFQVMACMVLPHTCLAMVELILSFIHNVPLINPFKNHLVIVFAIGHMYKTYFYWNLCQQFDVTYKAVTIGASWILTFVIARAAGLTGNANFDGASCLALTACLLGYAASKSDETKISVLKFIEKNDDPLESTTTALVQENRRKLVAAQNRKDAIKTEDRARL